jgi:uncharacterized protein YgiM (DUF1202 family)
MVTGRFGRRIQSTVLIGTVLIVSACASFNNNDSATTAGTITNNTDGTTSTTIKKGRFENPPEIQLSSMKKGNGPGDTDSQFSTDTITPAKSNIFRVSLKEKLVNVRTAPSVKSRSIAVLKGGHPVEVLETKGSWVKIQWQKGNTFKQGWMNKAFVEGN